MLKKKVREEGLEGQVAVDSCGTSNYHIGSGADPRTVANATANGVPIEHCARQLTAADLRTFDFVFAMDKSNYQNILRVVNGTDPQKRVRMMREFDTDRPGADVPDPYYGGEKDFQQVYEILDRCTSNFLEFVKKERLTGT
jgi:protein-tyrosine phosphatase